MADTVGDLIDGMRDMRIRNAILVTALRKAGGSISVSHSDAYDAAMYDIEVRREPGVLHVTLKDAPTSEPLTRKP